MKAHWGGCIYSENIHCLELTPHPAIRPGARHFYVTPQGWSTFPVFVSHIFSISSNALSLL